MADPGEFVQDGDEGVGEDEIVVDELAVGIARAVGAAPTQSFLRAGEDLELAFGVLDADGVGVYRRSGAARVGDAGASRWPTRPNSTPTPSPAPLHLYSNGEGSPSSNP